MNVDIVPRLRELAEPLGAKAGAAMDGLETTLEAMRHKGNRQLLIENFLMTLLPAVSPPGTRAPAPGRG